MPCYHPLQGWKSKKRTENGKRKVVFRRSEGFVDMPVKVPCGQCIGCRLDKSREWAIRCTHEASLYPYNCFITLTYSPEFLPKNGNLDKKELQRFFKRLRKRFSQIKIRYFACGEYGDKRSRPHYHACLFNFDFLDKQLWSSNNGYPLYRSETLEELWPKGHSTVGEFTFETAAYTARYVTKKISGKALLQENPYEKEVNGEIITLEPEFCLSSRKPGLGAPWLDRFSTDVYNDDTIVLKGKKMRAPKYYDNRFESINPSEMELIKRKRKKNMLIQEKKGDTTIDRLMVKKELKELKAKKLIRSLENE